MAGMATIDGKEKDKGEAENEAKPIDVKNPNTVWEVWNSLLISVA